MATAQAGASAASFPLPPGSLHSGPKMHFIPHRQSQWGPRASAETLPNGSGMWSWSCSMCWRRRHAPPSLPPTPRATSSGFMALQEQDPCPPTCSQPKWNAGAFYPWQTLPLARSGLWLGAAHVSVPPSLGDRSRQRVTALSVCHCHAREAASQSCPRTFPGQAEVACGR